MSAERERFHEAVLTGNDRQAMVELNGLNMEEMLAALAAVGQKHRERLQAALIPVVGQLDTRRMAYAFQVVADIAVPATAPGDLDATGQAQTAREFVSLPDFKPLLRHDANAAALAVLTVTNPASIRQNREYWGLVIQRGRLFEATPPQRSPEETGAVPVVAAPPGGKVVAIYHTHGAGFARVNRSTAAESFSIDDRMVCKKHDVDGYLGTPSAGLFRLVKPPAAERGNLLSLGKVVPLR